MAQKQTQKAKGCRAFNRKKRKPAQQRYVQSLRKWRNKERRAHGTANRTQHSVRIKIMGEWKTIQPTKKLKIA